MKNEPLNKTLSFKTGKDIAKLIEAKQKPASTLDTSLPTNETEYAIYDLWKTILGHDNFGANDDFFKIGGNSLKAVQIVSRIARQFSVDLSLTDVFLHPTITQLAAHILKPQKDSLSSSPIEINARPEFIPLSFSQERLWFIDQLEGSVQYHLPYILRLKGNLHKEAAGYALQTFVNRHEILRTVIRSNSGEGYQFIKDENTLPVPWMDGSQYVNNPQELTRCIESIIRKPFDLTQDHLLRVTFIELTEKDYIFVATLHHIVSDGWSKSIFVKELVELYNSYRAGNIADLPPLKLQYADYAIWQRKLYKTDWFNNKLSYWKNKLQGIQPLELPTDFLRPSVQSTRGVKIDFTIDEELLTGLQQLSQKEGVTLFMTLLSAFNVLLHRYSGQEDIGVGTPIANRTRKEVEELVGFFVNTLVLRNGVNSDIEFIEFLQQVRSTALEAYEHQEVPFEKIVEGIVKERDPSRNPLFQAMFILQNVPPIPGLSLHDVDVSRVDYESNTSQFDLTFIIMENVTGLKASVEYCTDLFKEQTIVQMIGHYKELLTSIVKDPNQKIGSLPMLTPAEEHQLLVEFNDTTVEYPQKTIIDLFEEQVVRTPGSIAILSGEKQLTYKELDNKANQLANFLISKSIKEGTFVPVCIDRSLEMVVAILGILKSGAAYVPIDTDYPEERIRYMLQDTNATILVTNADFAASFSAGEGIELILPDDDIKGMPSTKPATNSAPDHLACIIYTSGSAGKPKGVKLGNKGLVNRLYWMWNTYPFEPGEKNAIKTSIGFVDHICELFGALNRGITSVIFKKHELLDLDLLIKKLAVEKITRWVLVPSLLRTILNKLQADGIHLPYLKYWTSSGETLPLDLVDDFYKVFPSSSHKLLNIYGSSEVSADVTFYDTSVDYKQSLTSHQYVPIGKPLPNTKLYILDKKDHLVPQGVSGEICVSGVQVAQGYVNLPKLTSERFTIDPFKTNGFRMFKTGDFGRWLPDGNIEYQGRKDDQVKIRGNRIELGEIENILLQCKGVTQGVVVAKADITGTRQLVGYVLEEDRINKEALIPELQNKLPDYMVPLIWIELKAIPLTASGKIDRRSLPDPDINALQEKDYIAPRNEVEKKLAAIWQELLGVERISVHDNFFYLGGHSLLAMRVVSEIRKELDAELSIKDLFFHSTVASLAAHLGTVDKNNSILPPIQPMARPERIPLSFGQERLWFLNQLNSNVPYHINYVVRVKGDLNAEALEYALRTIVNRHEVFRTVIRSHDGEGYQFIKEKNTWRLNLVDGSGYINNPKELRHFIKSINYKAFDLTEDHLIRATLIRLTDNEHIFVTTIHHIAFDGWSRSIVAKELVQLYNSYRPGYEAGLPQLKLQYADFVLWQRKYYNGDLFANKLSYWKNKLEGIAPLELPTDYVRPVIESTNGTTIGFEFDKELLTGLQQLSQQHGVTLFMTLLAGFNVLLHRYTGQEDIGVGTPIANRTSKELEEIVGFFVNTLVLRSEVKSDSPFIEFLNQVKASTLEAYEHQDVPYEKVVESIVRERDHSRNPLFQVMFILQNMPPISHLGIPGMQLSREGYEHRTSNYDITVSLTETPDRLRGIVQYCTDLFTKETILRFIEHFKQLLKSIVKQPDQKIGLLQMLTPSEESQVLVTFNEPVIEYPKGKTIIDLFQEQVEKTPDAVAILSEEGELNYRQLNEKANQLAHYLRSIGVKEETLVPICIQRSLEMITGILGILKAGAAYVPIDTDYPGERIKFMINDTGAKLLITTTKCSSKLATSDSTETIHLDQEIPEIAAAPTSNLSIPLSSSNLCYVMYTSGSTGIPKGVLTEHRSLLKYSLLFKNYFTINSNDRFLQLSSIAFDTSVEDIFPSLISGASILLINNDSKDLYGIKNSVEEKGVTIVSASPRLVDFLNAELNDIGHLRTLISGGDVLHPHSVNNLLPKIKIVNTYGPTETTVAVTYNTITKAEDASLLGKPVGNGTIYILDQNDQLCPVGISGEICISGEGVARGYLNREELTSEKFVIDPFKSDGSRMYRTGDFGKWKHDGSIEYYGRKDDQLKLRSYRIELGEIETVIQQSNLVKQSVVLAKKDTEGNSALVGYIVPNVASGLSLLKDYLKSKLPEYMIPAMWVELEKFPYTANGKIDKKSLPDFDATQLIKKNYEPPRSETEKKLAAIWRELLGVEMIGIHNDFFHLGGHSLMAMRVLSAIKREFKIELSIKDLFQYTTINDLGEYIEFESDSTQELDTTSLEEIKI